MNIEKDFLITCENAVLDNTNKLTLVGIFDLIYAPSVPAAHSQFFAVCSYFVQDEKNGTISVNHRFSLLNSKNEPIYATETPENNIDIISKNHRVQVAINVGNVVFPEFGEYTCKLEVNGHEVGLRKISLVRKEVEK